MTETPGRYTRDDGSPFNKQKSSAELTAQSFVEGMQAFQWKANDYADQKYRAFQELVEHLNKFDTEALAKMIQSGIIR
ncbi:MAG TPA: hypothetical protein V6D35_12250 [Candidatus Sericytochromatia bacterium]|jgi:hypothetical protein